MRLLARWHADRRSMRFADESALRCEANVGAFLATRKSNSTTTLLNSGSQDNRCEKDGRGGLRGGWKGERKTGRFAPPP